MGANYLEIRSLNPRLRQAAFIKMFSTHVNPGIKAALGSLLIITFFIFSLCLTCDAIIPKLAVRMVS